MGRVVGALVVVLAACKPRPPEDVGGRAVVPMETAWKGLPAPTEAWVLCLSDVDCALAEIGCCDHCNGGRAVPARADHVADVVNELRESCDADACGTDTCQGPTPVCAAGRCAMETH